ncbi:MAG: hypothetical protein HY698_01645 [Deltaproteobacteria bacterium]|nr:hypothetical protein [Deltaproteobacteria bacterium]
MDFIFEEDNDEVGSDIEAFCPKCKADTAHTVITKYEEEIRRVQCSPCGDVHTFRKPRGDVDDEVPEPIAAKKRAAMKKPTWEEARARTSDRQLRNARAYSIREKYREGEIVFHPKFNIGFVTEISENKVEITFQDERRMLVHNRPDLAAQMPAIAIAPPLPEDVKEAKGKGRQAKKEDSPAAKKDKAASPKEAKVAEAQEPQAKESAKPKGAKAKELEKAGASAKPAVKPKHAERAKAAVAKKGGSHGKPAGKKPAAEAKKAARPAPAAKSSKASPKRSAAKKTKAKAKK